MSSKQRDEIRSSDLPLVATLVALGHPWLRVDRSDLSRQVFAFEQSEALEATVLRFEQGTLQVEPMKYWEALRRCKRRLHDKDANGR